MWISERQIDRAFHRRPDGGVVFQPTWGKAYLVPSAERETELRDGWRRVTLGMWWLVVGFPVVSAASRLAAAWLIPVASPLALLKTALLVRLAVTVLYVGGATWSVSRSLAALTSDLQPTMVRWAAPAWIRSAAGAVTRRSLTFVAAAGALVGIGSVVVVVLSSRFPGRSETIVAGVGILGLLSYLWCRLLMLAQHTVSPIEPQQAPPDE